jgi:DNA-binding CsgD family transcriptional regulator
MDSLLERESELAAVEELLQRGSATVLVEAGLGIGKTSLLEAACRRATAHGHQILRARGSQLESGFAFGAVRQLFERRLAHASASERQALLAGPAEAVRPLLLGEWVENTACDTSFAVLHGLYWLTANLADRRPVLIVVDDTHWADAPSLRWMAHLAPRLEGLAVALLVALRPDEPQPIRESLASLRAQALKVLRPGLLSERAVGTLVGAAFGPGATDDLRAAVWKASGGNPLYVTELLRAPEFAGRHLAGSDRAAWLASGSEAVGRRVLAGVRWLDPCALRFAQALAVLGDGCRLHDAAEIAGLKMADALSLAAGLARMGVLAAVDPPHFMHPIVRAAVDGSLAADERDAAHRAAARLLYAAGAPPGRVAAHLMSVRPAGDGWVVACLRAAAQAALQSGAPAAAADLLCRAMAEPPPRAERIDVLREAARAQASAGSETACVQLEEALRLAADKRQRAQIALEMAEAYAALFRWVDAVDVVERALQELGEADEALAARLEGELVVCGLHDARRASRVARALDRLAVRAPAGSEVVEAQAVAQGMAMVLAGRPADQAAVPLEAALSRAAGHVENWNTRAALLWSLVTAERFDAVDAALRPMVADAQRCGSARAFVATYSTLGLLKLRLGALAEADAAARIALRVLQEGDLVPGLAFAVTVLVDVALEAGELAEAQTLLDLLPQEGWPAGVGSVLIPAVRGRLRLAQGRPADALADFQSCAAMFSPELWGAQMRDVGYLHARAGAAQALLRLGERDAALRMAQAELADARVFGAALALGISSRVAGLAQGGKRGLELLGESVASLSRSPAALERARSLTEFGAALRRANQRAAAREPLAKALDLATRCGARPLAARAREELRATGARPRRAWRSGVEALTPLELRTVRLAVEGRTNREIAHELYVTIKTVEHHLSRAYGKLGIDNRAQLSRALEGEKIRVATP